MADFPTIVTTNGDPTGSSLVTSPGHAEEHQSHNAEIKATQTKIGTGASTPASGKVLRATGTGSSAWGQTVLSTDVATATSADLRGVLSDETGSGVAVFGTAPTISNPTISGGGSWAGSPTLSTPTIASFANATHDHSNSAGGGVLTHTAFPAGAVVQVVSTNYSAVATGTTTIPHDDTIPQITEGTEFMTQAITPKSATNILVIEAEMSCSHSANSQRIGALFQDATVNALAAKAAYMLTVDNPVIVRVTHTMTAGTTSSTTFRLRGGGDAGGTFTFNGVSGARKFGGVTLSNIKITEYKA